MTNKDNIYWCIFKRLKKKYPAWSKIQVGTVAYKVRNKYGRYRVSY